MLAVEGNSPTSPNDSASPDDKQNTVIYHFKNFVNQTPESDHKFWPQILTPNSGLKSRPQILTSNFDPKFWPQILTPNSDLKF